MTKPTVWVLTREHNDYDQYGRYYVKVFSKKPNHETLAKILSEEGYGSVGGSDLMQTLAYLECLLKGGGRISTEDVWFNLTQEELI